MPDVSRSPQWHAVRPWSPRFLLTVREITSVSTTFVLSSTCARDGVDARLASLGIASGLGSDDEETIEDEDEAARLGMAKLSMVSDALGRGLSVNVNGAPWKRVLMRMDEKSDSDGDEEAIIVIYGLMPGRQYDVEVGVSFADGEEVLRSRMVTQPQPGQSSNEEADISVESSSPSLSAVSSSSAITPLNTQRPAITLEEYASQLRAQLAYLNQEREKLASQLKTARKEAHKADAAKRNEIDALKRASEKHAAAELRGRQKAKALQEAAKQASAVAREAEESARELDDSLPALRARESELAAKHASAAAEATRAQAEADEALAADRSRTDALRNELNGLKTRLEKLQAKKARLSGETLPKIEKQLDGLVREVELVARDAGAFEVIDNGPVGFDLVVRPAPGGQQTTPGQMTSRGSLTIPSVPPTTALASPQAQISRQPVQAGLKSSPGTATIATGSTCSGLSSRAPPFDPGSAFAARLGPAFQLQINSPASSPRRANPLVQTQQPSGHVQSQSVDVGSTTLRDIAGIVGSGVRVETGGGLGTGPTRQSSLPAQMPSQTERR